MGLSFAIPIEMAVDVADQIKEKGSVSEWDLRKKGQ